MTASYGKKHKSYRAGVFFSAFILIFIVLSLIFGAVRNSLDKDDTSGVFRILGFLPSVLSVVIVTVINAFLSDKNDRFDFGIRKTGVKYWALAALLFVGTFFGLAGVNSVFIEFLSENFGYNYVEPSFPMTTVGYVFAVITVCLLPAIAEETVFRGVMTDGLSGLNVYAASALTAVAFSLYHMNPAQTVYQFIVGFLFCMLRIRSGSVFPTVAVHFLNNFLIITSYYYFPSAFVFTGAAKAIVVFGGLLCIAIFIALCATDKNKLQEGSPSVTKFLLGGAIGFIVCTAMWISALFV